MIRLVNTKMKDAEPPRRLAFALESVDLGNGASSAVLKMSEAGTAPEHRITKAQKLAKDAYIDAAAANGIWTDEAFTGLHLEDWRAEFYAKHTGDTPDAKKKAFQRVRQDLQALGLISAENDVYRWNAADVALSIMCQRKSGTSGTDRDNVPLSPDAEAGESGTSGTNAYRHVPCPVPTGINGEGQLCARCDGVGCDWCDR